jgi:hypothetical protein
MSLIAPPEAVYPDADTATASIQAHAKDHGYAFCIYNARPHRLVLTCDRAGKYNSKGKDPNTHSTKQRKNTSSKKCRCLIKVALCLDKISDTWNVKVLEAVHNHGPSVASTAHPIHRSTALTLTACATISTLSRAGLQPRQILTTLRSLDPEIGLSLIPKDISNFTQKARLEELDGRTPIQWLLEVRYLPFLSTYTNLYRSFKVVTLILDISLKVGLSNDLLSSTLSPVYSGRRILISYSLIVPIRPTDTTCHSLIYVQSLATTR